MSNFIDSMFKYEYVRKSDNEKKSYFGIHEVVQGADFAQGRAIKKYESRIENVLAYPLKNKKKEISHMSLQSFPTFLNKEKKVARDNDDDRYYPFVLEFETNKKEKVQEVYNEVLIYFNSLMRRYKVDERDIKIIINNNKSTYVWVAPQVFGLKPCKDLHNIYTEMYKVFKEDLGLKFVDESVVSSSYRLIKTPGSWYKGGYVVNVSLQEYYNLALGNITRKELTNKQRDIRKAEVLNKKSVELTRLYKDSMKIVIERKNNNKKKKENKVLLFPGEKVTNRPCINKILKLGMVEKGHRNDLLVSLAIGLKDAGFNNDAIEAAVEQKSIEWQHDESVRAVRNKVKTILRRDTNFSCEKAKLIFEAVGLNGACINCTKSKAIWISRNIIKELYIKKASLRHYEAYLNLEKYGLLERGFTLEEAKVKERTLKELSKILCCKFKKENEEIYTFKIKKEKSKSKLPLDFMETTFVELGESVKQYLYILIKACDGNEDTAYISMGIKRLANYLGYKNENSIYTLLKKLENKGLLRFNKKQGITLFYKTYKVIDINKVREEKRQGNENIEVKQIVNGTQLTFNIEKMSKESCEKVNNEGNNILNKGSCRTYEIRGRGHSD